MGILFEPHNHPVCWCIGFRSVLTADMLEFDTKIWQVKQREVRNWGWFSIRLAEIWKESATVTKTKRKRKQHPPKENNKTKHWGTRKRRKLLEFKLLDSGGSHLSGNKTQAHQYE